MITDEDVIEFQELYEKRFGAVIDREEAIKKLTLLVRQMEIIYQPVTKSEYEEYVNEHGDEDERHQNIHRNN